MYFQHSARMWQNFPELVPAVLAADGITTEVAVDDQLAKFTGIAEHRLANATESELPEIQAWRRTFSAMGLKPTQYRCAAEALLRRFRKEGSLPRIHPLIDFCNAVSLAFATPVAVFDTAEVTGGLEVRHATGTETYLAFSGDTEHPAPDEVIFADEAGLAHARRWTNRQSLRSAIRDRTSSVLIVAEAVHESATVDIPRLLEAIADGLRTIWSSTPTSATLTPTAPRFEWAPGN